MASATDSLYKLIAETQAERNKAEIAIESTLKEVQTVAQELRKAVSRDLKDDLRCEAQRLTEHLQYLREKESKLRELQSKLIDLKAQPKQEPAPPASIHEFLERYGPTGGKHLPQTLTKSLPESWPVLGRDDFFDTIFENIADRLVTKPRSSDRQDNPIIATQSAPGGGKSFALNCIAQLHPAFINDARVERYLAKRQRQLTFEQKEQVRCLFDPETTLTLAVTFNSSTSVIDHEFELKPRKSLVYRILHDYCKFGDNLWETAKKLETVDDKDLHIQKILWAIMAHESKRRGLPQIKRVVLVVDELIKANNATDVVTHIGEALNDVNLPFACVLSTLDRLPVLAVTTKSGRPIQWAPLTPLPFQQLLSSSLFLPWKEHRSVEMALATCGGWPRYVQWLHDILEQGEEDGLPIADNLPNMILLLLKQTSGSLASYFSLKILRPAILNEEVLPDAAPDPSKPEDTYSKLIEIGVYCNALTYETKFVPTIAPFLLLSYAAFPEGDEYRSAMHYIYESLPNADWRSHEKMVFATERLRRAVLREGETKPYTIRKLFPDALQNDSAETKKLLKLQVQLRGGCSAVKVRELDSWDQPELKDWKQPNRVLRAPPNNPGFDVFTSLEGKGGSPSSPAAALAVVECKFSFDQSNTKLEKRELEEIRNNSLDILRKKLSVDPCKVPVVVVLIAYRDVRQSLSAADVPDGVLVMSRGKLKGYFGPSLWGLYEFFAHEAWKSR